MTKNVINYNLTIEKKKTIILTFTTVIKFNFSIVIIRLIIKIIKKIRFCSFHFIIQQVNRLNVINK